MSPLHWLSLLTALSQYCFLVVGQTLNYNYFYNPPTYSYDAGNVSAWPCGKFKKITTEIPLYDFYMQIANQSPGTDISFLMTSGNGTLDFDILLGRTVNVQNAGWVSWFVDLSSVAEDGQVKTIQMIANNGTLTTYTCIQVSFDANATSNVESDSGPTNTSFSNTDNPDSSTTTLANYTTDGLLANGSAPNANFTSVPFVDQAAANVASSSPSASPSSSLSTGAKIGLGVGVSLAVVLVGVIAFAIIRNHRRPTEASKSRFLSRQPTSSTEKPELHGSAYDATIAGPVKSKPELAINEHTRHEAESRFHPSATHPELPHPSFASAKAPWTHSQDGYLPPELGNNMTSYGSSVGGGGPGEAATISSGVTVVAPHGVTGAPQSTYRDDRGADDDVLASEADFLVQELGLISMRKKALTSAATSQGIRPEDAPGTRGEDYRELVQREIRLRGRIAEMDRRRGGGMGYL